MFSRPRHGVHWKRHIHRCSTTRSPPLYALPTRSYAPPKSGSSSCSTLYLIEKDVKKGVLTKSSTLKMESVRSSETSLSIELRVPTSQKTAKFKRHALVQPVPLSLQRLAVHAPLPIFHDIPFSGIRSPITVCSILKGSDDLRTFEDDGNAFLPIFGQRLPCNTDSHLVTADS